MENPFNIIQKGKYPQKICDGNEIFLHALSNFQYEAGVHFDPSNLCVKNAQHSERAGSLFTVSIPHCM
jgi:hypothetical protein